MTFRKMLTLGLIVGAAAVSGCADDYYGGGVSTGYYSGPVGLGGDYYGGYGYPSYGYYNDAYYPGYGSFVFDRGGRRRGWNDDERGHWEHHGEFRGNHLRANGGFDGRRDRAYMADRSAAYRGFRQGGGGGRAGGARQGGRPGGGAHQGGEHGRH